MQDKHSEDGLTCAGWTDQHRVDREHLSANMNHVQYASILDFLLDIHPHISLNTPFNSLLILPALCSRLSLPTSEFTAEVGWGWGEAWDTTVK